MIRLYKGILPTFTGFGKDSFFGGSVMTKSRQRTLWAPNHASAWQHVVVA
jgi:hypothetical protein